MNDDNSYRSFLNKFYELGHINGSGELSRKGRDILFTG